MTISWYGHFCFKLATSATKPVTLLINPYSEYKELGLGNVSLQRPDIVVNYNPTIPVNGDFVIDSPGEYNIKDIDIYGAKENGNQIYFINIDNIKCLYLGEIKAPEISPKVFSLLPKNIDILFVPVGGDFTLEGKKHKALDADGAANLIKQLNPKIIIPMHFKVPPLKLKIDDALRFLKLLGKKAEPQEKVNIKEKDLNGKEKEVILLKP